MPRPEQDRRWPNFKTTRLWSHQPHRSVGNLPVTTILPQLGHKRAHQRRNYLHVFPPTPHESPPMKPTRILAIAALVSGLTTAASAATMQLEATALTSLSGDVVSDFSITFEDTGNGLLDRAEITAFSGLSYLRAGASVAEQFIYVDMVPLLTGIAGGTSDRWAFADDMSGTLLAASNWSYRVSTVQAQSADVPIPAAGLLLPMALAGLGLAKRRKRQV